MKHVGPALIAVLLSIMFTGIAAAVLIPVLDSAFAGIAQGLRSVLAIALVLVFVGMVYGLSVLLYEWQLKRAQKLAQKQQEEADPNFERKPVIAFVALGLICVAILAYQLLVSTDRNTNIPSLIGEKAVYGLIIWSVFNHFLGKHLNQHSKGLSFVVVLVATISASYWTAEMRAQTEADALARIQGNLLSLLEDDMDGRIAPIVMDENASNSEYAALEASINEYLNQVIANRNDYLTELDAIGYDSLVDGNRIREDTDLARSRFIVERAHAIVDKYEQLNEQTALDYRDSFAGDIVSEVARQSFIVSFDEKLAPNLERARQIWELERQALTKVDELVQFLAMSASSWTMEDDQYLFETDKNLAIFNKILTEIEENTAQQDALREASASGVRERVDAANG